MWCAASRSTSAPGEIVALLGRNGMGKTTLIRSIMGLTPPQVRGGVDHLARRNARRPAAARHRRAADRDRAAGPAAVPVADGDRASDHAEERARHKGWTVERVFALFPRLAERRHHRGGQLSGGERSMLAVGRALMIDPELILMDEPSEGLAPVMVQHLEDIVLDLKRDGLVDPPGRAEPLQRARRCRPRLYPRDRKGRARGNVERNRT